MCPIKGVSEARRVPRLGKIHLGEKVERPGKNPYPKATDYFVVPDEIKPMVGEKPKELKVMFPSDDVEAVAPQWLRCYGLTHGLVCWGDGEQCHRKVDTETGALASRDTKDWEWREMTCNPQECEEYGARCKKVMNLMVLLPEVPGLGIWQIDTSSFYSIREINSTLEFIKRLTGRIAFIPLTLALGPQEVEPKGMSRKTVFIMRLKTDLKIKELIQAAVPAPRLKMPEPDVEERPEDLFPESVVEGTAKPPFEEEPPPPPAPTPESVEERSALWRKIRELMPAMKVTAKTARSYFAQVHDLSVPVADLDKETPPEGLQLTHLTAFLGYLEKHRMRLA